MRRLPKTQKKLPMSKKDEPDFYALNKSRPLPSLEDAPIPLVNTNSGGTMGGSSQHHDSDSAKFSNQQQQQTNLSTVRSPMDFQTSAVSAVPQMVQRYTGGDLYSPSQFHGLVHSGMGQLQMQPLMVSATPGVISAPVVQGTNIGYGNPHLQAVTLRQQPGHVSMMPPLMQQNQGVDAGYLVGGLNSSPMGGAVASKYYQSYPMSNIGLLPSQGYEGQVMTMPQVPEHMMMRNQLQHQQRVFIGIE